MRRWIWGWVRKVVAGCGTREAGAAGRTLGEVDVFGVGITPGLCCEF